MRCVRCTVVLVLSTGRLYFIFFPLAKKQEPQICVDGRTAKSASNCGACTSNQPNQARIYGWIHTPHGDVMDRPCLANPEFRSTLISLFSLNLSAVGFNTNRIGPCLHCIYYMCIFCVLSIDYCRHKLTKHLLFLVPIGQPFIIHMIYSTDPRRYVDNSV